MSSFLKRLKKTQEELFEHHHSSPADGCLPFSVKKISGNSPFPRIGFSAIEGVDGKEVFIFGGLDPVSKTPVNDTVGLSLNGLCSFVNPLITTGVPPTPRCFHACEKIGKKIFVFGGLGSGGGHDESIFVFSSGLFCVDYR
jgi:hypothetical protein